MIENRNVVYIRLTFFGAFWSSNVTNDGVLLNTWNNSKQNITSIDHQFCATYMLYLSIYTFKTKNKKWNCLIFLIFYTPEGYSLHNRSNPRMAFQMVVRCPSPNSSRKLGRMFKSWRKAVILSFSLLTLKNNQITLNFIFEELFLFLQLTCLCLRTLENI